MHTYTNKEIKMYSTVSSLNWLPTCCGETTLALSSQALHSIFDDDDAQIVHNTIFLYFFRLFIGCLSSNWQFPELIIRLRAVEESESTACKSTPVYS